VSKKPEDIIRDEILALAGYHIADAAGMVKLDAMENPYSLPEEIRKRIGAIVARAEINRYPDPHASRLKATLREALDVPEGAEILLGNGSDEIIQMLMLATARPGAAVMTVDPAFVMFRLVAAFCGMKYVTVPLAADFSLDADRVIAAIEEHQPPVIFIAYPNNPTGNLFDDAAIDRVLEAAPGMVVVDEAYHAFASRTYMARVPSRSNLLVMRTLSKSGLAGLRLGLVVGRTEWVRQVEKVRLPYNVGVLTQLVAEEALQHRSLLDEQAKAIKAERTRVHGELQRMPGLQPFPSEANFILFRSRGADRAYNGLKARGVLVRNLHGSHPALAECLRVTVSTPEENDRFLTALRESL
jgi:histidinol-phosphate aminotransferase